jgi:hypothetical protein
MVAGELKAIFGFSLTVICLLTGAEVHSRDEFSVIRLRVYVPGLLNWKTGSSVERVVLFSKM